MYTTHSWTLLAAEVHLSIEYLENMVLGTGYLNYVS